jgi:glyoxylase-like metal-dependent hydrolase (beta-lactamase superfamily II)
LAAGSNSDALGKRQLHCLTTIYITHGHADHWFGVSALGMALLDRFPNSKVVTTQGTVKVMREEVEPRRAKIWNTFFPGQIPYHLVIAEELEDNVIELEGNELSRTWSHRLTRKCHFS